jgi:hypothetical protein
MAYGEESQVALPMTTRGNVTATDWTTLGFQCDLGTAAEFFAEFACPYTKAKLIRVQFLVTEVFVASCVIKVFKNTTLLSTHTMGTHAVGSVQYFEPTSLVTLDAGDYISMELDVADTTTGMVLPSVLVEPIPDTPANISDMDTTGVVEA